MKTIDHTAANWQVLSHIYGGWVTFREGQLCNIHLPRRHFLALKLAARTKPLCRRSRKDDSLRNAVGNWLYTPEFGAWRNTNFTRRYKEDNQRLWAEFLDSSVDSSLEQAVSPQ
jgi:hypothetical protein